MGLIERSEQEIPITPEKLSLPASSVPLHALEAFAPEVPEDYDLLEVDHPFSNDESAPYYDQLQARASTAEYGNATNRTAIIIGEGSLMSALPFIPEETIVLLDKSAPMVSFMTKYVNDLKEADGINDWGERMGFRNAVPGTEEHSVTQYLFSRLREWQSQGYASALEEETHFKTAQTLARKKAIIPWQGDITSKGDIKQLSRALEHMDATVTFMNLSNVMSDGKTFKSASDFAKRLKYLPLTPNAPIMTTSTKRKGSSIFSGSYCAEATGPFFGLENLKRHGGKVSVAANNPGAVALREYVDGAGPEDSFVGALSDMLGGVIEDGNRSSIATVPILSLGEEGSVQVSIEEVPPEFRDAIHGMMD